MPRVATEAVMLTIESDWLSQLGLETRVVEVDE